MRYLTRPIGIILILATLGSTAPAVAGNKYTVLDLGVGLTPIGLNDLGQVTGTFTSSSFAGTHAFITGKNGTGLVDIGNLGGGDASVFAINNKGQVVGQAGLSTAASNADPYGYSEHAFLYTPGTGMIDFTIASNYDIGYATSINNRGQIAGLGPTGHVFITGPKGVGGVSYPTQSAYSIEPFVDDSGQFLSFGTYPASLVRYGIINPNGTVVEFTFAELDKLHTYYGFTVGFIGPFATSMNNSADVVGFWYGSLAGVQRSSVPLIFLASASKGTVKFLNAPDSEFASPHTVNCSPLGINDHGVIVGSGFEPNPGSGTAISSPATTTAFIFQDERFSDLNAFVRMPAGVYLKSAQAINNVGDILAVGSDAHAYLLIGEPDDGE